MPRFHPVCIGILVFFIAAMAGCSRSSLDVDSPDLTLPAVVSSSPADALDGVLTSSTITVDFNIDMDQSSITSSTLDVKQGATPVAGTISFPGPQTARFTPSAALGYLTDYTVAVKKEVRSAHGVAMAQDYTFSFKTVPLSAVFIDPSAPVSGSGTAASPYRKWSEVPAFNAGYSYLQKRGTVAREQLIITASGTSGSPITLGAYGEGAAPIIQGSELETGWTHHSGNVYSKAIASGAGEGIGMVTQDGTPLKFVTWDTNLATTLSNATPGSYFYEYINATAGTIYVWCIDGATPDAHTMQVSRRLFGVRGVGVSYVNVENLHFRCTSLHGISFVDAQNINVKGCVIEKLGGAVVLTAPSIIYAGNGIEFGNSSSSCAVTGCTISDIFDSGISPQTFDSSKTASNFTFADSTVTRCGFAGVEIAVLSNSGAWTNSSLSNVTVSGITVTDSGKGWSGVRYKDMPPGNPGEGRGIKIGADGSTNTMSGIVIENVTVSGSEGSGIMIFGEVGNVNISRSRIFNNGRNGIEVSDGTSTSIGLTVASSLVYGNGGAADLYGISYYAVNGSDLRVYHTTFYDNDTIGLAIWAANGTDIRNNLFHSSTAVTHLYSNINLAGEILDYNCYEENGAQIIHVNGETGTPYLTVASLVSNTAFEDHGIGTGDPRVNADFTLQATSPCRGAGITGTGVTTDYTGTPFSNPPSIGAYEY